jgi:uncharacterized membrane protein HdeD (DUF308 family)
MKNPALYYALIGVGVIALIVGIVYFTGALGTHHLRAYAGLGVGIVLLIAGVAGLFVNKPKAA